MLHTISRAKQISSLFGREEAVVYRVENPLSMISASINDYCVLQDFPIHSLTMNQLRTSPVTSGGARVFKFIDLKTQIVEVQRENVKVQLLC